MTRIRSNYGGAAVEDNGIDLTPYQRMDGAQLATYAVMGTGYAGYATPTDMIALRGSASKIVRVISWRVLIAETTAALRHGYFVKRSTANAGGTAATPTPVSFDSTDPAATAVLAVYSVIPASLGTSLGSISETIGLTTVLTSAGGAWPLSALPIPISSLVHPNKSVTLRGVAESLAFNWAGAALPSGFSANYEVVWTESDV